MSLRTLLVCISLCAACNSEDTPSGDCFGALAVAIPLTTTVPQNLEIIWDGVSVLNECDATQRADVLYFAKEATRVVVERGGLTFYVPAQISITVNDLKDCAQTAEPVVAVENHPVPGEPSCREDSVTLAPMR